MERLENDDFLIDVKMKGAELCSFFHKKSKIEYIWQGESTIWGRHSPILFPIVGTLKGGTYIHNNQSYKLPRHGFARDLKFECIEKSENYLVFQSKADEFTKTIFPFNYVLKIIYILSNNVLLVKYEVFNTDSVDMYFSIGAHPAFNVPLNKQLAFQDYYLELQLDTEQSIPIPRYPINADGLQCDKKENFLNSPKSKIFLDYNLFNNDAWVFKNINGGKIKIGTDKDIHTVTVSYKSFPYLGIWSKPGADFLCIEPWCGITDSINTSGIFKEKEGIIKLLPESKWESEFIIRVE